MDVKRLGMNFGGRPSLGYGGDFEVDSNARGRIPRDYIDFIRVADGGHPEVGSFNLPGTDERNVLDADVFYSWGDSRGRNIRLAIERWGKALGENALPIGQDGGGNQIYIDLTSESGSIWIYLHDEGQARIKVADTFEQFIAMLRINPDFI